MRNKSESWGRGRLNIWESWQIHMHAPLPNHLKIGTYRCIPRLTMTSSRFSPSCCFNRIIRVATTVCMRTRTAFMPWISINPLTLPRGGSCSRVHRVGNRTFHHIILYNYLPFIGTWWGMWIRSVTGAAMPSGTCRRIPCFHVKCGCSRNAIIKSCRHHCCWAGVSACCCTSSIHFPLPSIRFPGNNWWDWRDYWWRRNHWFRVQRSNWLRSSRMVWGGCRYRG